MSAYPYILRCADASYGAGATASSFDKRVGEHQASAQDGHTSRPDGRYSGPAPAPAGDDGPTED